MIKTDTQDLILLFFHMKQATYNSLKHVFHWNNKSNHYKYNKFTLAAKGNVNTMAYSNGLRNTFSCFSVLRVQAKPITKRFFQFAEENFYWPDLNPIKVWPYCQTSGADLTNRILAARLQNLVKSHLKSGGCETSTLITYAFNIWFSTYSNISNWLSRPRSVLVHKYSVHMHMGSVHLCITATQCEQSLPEMHTGFSLI